MEVYEGEKIVQGYVVDQEMQETVVIPQAAVSAAAETTEAPLPESPSPLGALLGPVVCGGGTRVRRVLC